MKPEPLDLEDIKNKVIEEIEKEINIFNKQEEEKGRWFSDYYKKYGEPIQTGLIWHRGYEERLEICPYLKKKFNKLVKEITQRLKSAVEGLKDELEDFKDKNPSLDTWVYSEILRMIDKWFKMR